MGCASRSHRWYFGIDPCRAGGLVEAVAMIDGRLDKQLRQHLAPWRTLQSTLPITTALARRYRA